MIERTLVILKPDAVKRKLCGRILDIFEEAGFDIVEGRFFTPARELIERHYPSNDKYYASLGNKSLANYKEQGLDIKAELGTDDAREIGISIKGWLVDYMTSGPVMAVVLQGNGAIRNVRKLCGDTLPSNAAPGTIRARFSLDSSDYANAQKRSLHNLMHSSGNADEARYEIELWFGKGKADV